MLHYALHYQAKKDIMPLVTVTMQKASAEISICVNATENQYLQINLLITKEKGNQPLASAPGSK